MTDLTKKDKAIGSWNEKCTGGFEELKNMLVNAPVLVASNWKRPFKLHFDSSQYDVRGTLTQEDEEERTRFIAYTSKKMTTAKQNYTVNGRALLGLVNGLQLFRRCDDILNGLLLQS